LYKKIFLALSIIVVFNSCSNSKKKSQKNQRSIKIEGVTLHKGKLWNANKETTNGIKKMTEILESFSQNNTIKPYKQLKENLENVFVIIFSKCTMKGEAHKQLHNYLKPMIDYFNNLESEDIKVREESFNKLKLHTLGYTNYFK